MAWFLPWLVWTLPVAPPGDSDYLRDVKPVLQRRCYACHGALKQKAGLRLDTAEAMRKGGDSGPAVEPGAADESLIIDAVTGEAGFRMPPEGEPLSDAEIAALRSWIDAGTPAPPDEQPQADPRSHWAFQPPVRREPPAVRDPAWARNPIDAFIAAEHEARGLDPVPTADAATLLRRASLDLTGLIPTADELQEFLQDGRPDAYERAVEHLLASPRYGERWGRHWMDVWRYADWAGFGAEVRESQPHIWRWRDWIVESLNRGKPYDRMILEMLAGDEVAPDDPQTVRATGYLVRNWYKFNRNVWLQNTVDHTAKAFLGLTLACARCHDHKYDPLPMTDWYAMRAIFEPHEIATDRLPGQPDTAKDGVARVYDAHNETPTYLFLRGDETEPDKENPIPPGLPRLFGAELAPATVPLPPTAHYPGLRQHIRAETLAEAEAQSARAAAALAEAEKARNAGEERLTLLRSRPDASPVERAEAEQTLDVAVAEADAARSRRMAALTDLEWTKARLAADAARFAQPPDPKNAEILAIVAAFSERRAGLLKAEAARLEALAARKKAQAAAERKPGDAEAKKALAAADVKLMEAEKALTAARQADNGKPTTAYTPLLPPRPTTSTGRRSALARWMSDRSNPLTARVAVNHIWMRHFGQPLVPTVFDFGHNGKPPSHPALLDWLAVELMDSGWNLKHLHRLIVTSQTYRLQSWNPADAPQAKLDPRNVYLWRMNPRRMEAELVRDNLLHVAGTLEPILGGPDLDHNAGLTIPRRSIYFRHAAEKQMTFLKLFDAANVNACYRRDESIMPQQALALVNSPLALAQARRLAARLSAEVGGEGSPGTDAAFIAAAFVRILGRPPGDEESSTCQEYLSVQARRLADRASLTPFSDGPESPVPPSQDPHQRSRENLVHVLLNHHEFITIR